VSELAAARRCQFADLSPLSLGRFAETPPDWRERAGWVSPAPRWPAPRRVTGAGTETMRGRPIRAPSRARRPGPSATSPRLSSAAGRPGSRRPSRRRAPASTYLLVDENPFDNDMMAMDVPLYFGQRMQPSVRIAR